MIMLLCVAGCGGAAVPQDQMQSATGQIREAEGGGARDVPKAALHLKLAEDQVAKAKTMMEQGNNEEAALVLDCAKADAEYALALAREEQTKKDAEAMAKQVDEYKRKAAKQP